MDNATLLHEIDVEIADTPESRERGLMHRDNIPNDSGMMFDFGKDTNQAFWGKNTLQPLDIAFMDKSGMIISVHTIKPMSKESVLSPRPCRLAVEVPKGEFEKHGIGPGCHCRHNGRRMRFYKKVMTDD